MGERRDMDALPGGERGREGQNGKGRLKIFFGYAAGVGKTFAMLEAAHEAKKEGADVVAGCIEPHTCPETMARLEGLELLPPRQVEYKGALLEEFDLDAALARRPQLLLVDELAHTNAEGSRHRKRYQDVEELLRAGIDVYTTVNVQNLESLNDVVFSITGVAVSERVPDSIFDSSAQIELVDIEPGDLIARLRQGKVCRACQAQGELTGFFTPQNLAALREIALRRTADRLSRTAAEQQGEVAPKRGSEHVLTCVSASPSNAKVIRAAARMAEAFHSSFTALYVERPDARDMHEEDRRRLRGNIKLAEDLGARIATAYGDDIVAQIAEYAKVSGVSKIVIGRSNNRRPFLPRRSLIDRLTRLAPSLDVYIIPDSRPPYAPPRSKARADLRITPPDGLKSLAVLAAATLLSFALYGPGSGEANIITIYILGVLVTSIWTEGWVASALVSILSVVVFGFLFAEPRFTLAARGAGYPVTLFIMLTASLITSSLTTKVKKQARLSAQKAYRTEVLLQTSQKLQQADEKQEIIRVSAEQIVKLLERPVVFYTPEGGGLSGPALFPAIRGQDMAVYTTADEGAAAQWVFVNNKHAGAGTNTLPGAKCLYMAVRGQAGVQAVIGIGMDGGAMDAYEKNLLVALLGECGLALEKAGLDAEKQRIELRARQEELRANLLRAISHDLRTPLTSISGNAGILLGNSAVLDEEKKRSLYTDIYDDAMWLVNLVENLLSVTRIENGSMDIRLEPELLDEVFHEALSHLDRRAGEHVVTSELSDDMLMARMDARLIVQVIINIVNNAVKYTPPGSHIALSAKREGEDVAVEIADDGPGIPDESKARLFEMFYTAGNARGDGRRGMGLGLSLCKSIVAAHGGAISVRDNTPRGTVFRFTLKAMEVKTDE